MKNSPRKPPQNDAEWARNTEKRLRFLEGARSLRVGSWVIADRNGSLTATKPGQTLDVGTEPVEPVIADLTRGYVTPEELTKVVTGGSPGPLAEAQQWLTDRWNAFISTPAQVIGSIGDVIMDGVESVGTFLNRLWGSFTGSSGTGKKATDVATAAAGVTSSANAGVTLATTADGRVTNTNTAIYNGYFGSGGTGTSTQVQETVAAIKTKLESGYTLETLTTSGTWTRPWTPGGVDEPTEFWAICFGSGGGGGAGQYATSGTVVGGNPGQAGSYAAIQIDVADIGSTVSYTVATGPAGQSGATRQTVAGGTPTPAAQTSFGSFITTLAGRAFVSSLFGYYSADDSAPGTGGVGGGVTAPEPTAGTSTPMAAGGTAGSNPDYIAYTSPYTPAVAGGAGGTATLTATTRAGGGGGGGGGAGRTVSGVGGLLYFATNGGNGGFPGGSGGGGGAMRNERNTAGYNPGSGGSGAHGVIILLWK